MYICGKPVYKYKLPYFDVDWPLYVYLFYILCKRRAAAVHQLICTIDIADCSKTRNLEIYYNNSHSYQYDIIAITVFFVAPKQGN